jgi:uncharacterized repeat protein (TIGR02543 family)
MAQSSALKVLDQGRERSIDFANDEVEVFVRGETHGGRLKQVLEGKVAGATVIHDLTSHVVVKVEGGYDPGRVVAGTDAFRRALPGSEVAPVLYVSGSSKDEWNRRIGTNEILAILKEGTTAEELAQQTGAIQIVPNPITNVARLKYPTAFHALDATKKLTSAGVTVQPLFKRMAQRFSVNLPQDEFFPDQWHLVNTGQNGATVGVDINVLPAWNLNKGQGVIVGVIDDCLQVVHPDLRDNCPPVSSHFHHDFNDDDEDPSPVIARGDGHGTCVSGLIAARQNNGSPNPANGKLLGVSGVAPEATLYGLRAIGGPFTDAEAAEAFTWAPGGASVDITNNSWGYPIALGGLDLLARAGLHDAATKGRNGRGTVSVFAAGNGRFETADSNRTLPSNSRYVVTVGALNAAGLFSSYSSPGANLLVCAPGGEFGFFGDQLRMTTTDVSGIGGFNPGAGDYSNTDYTRQMNGTSSATPITSGVIALMLKANPNLGWRDVKEILAGTARRVDPSAVDWIMRPNLAANDPDRLYNEAGFKFNHDYGAGLIDAFAAVTRSLTWKNLPGEVAQSVSITEPAGGGIIPTTFTPLTRDFTFGGPNYPNLRVEQIEVEVQIKHPFRAALQIAVTSPSGVTSILTNSYDPFGFPDDGGEDYSNLVVDDNSQIVARGGGWVFTSTHDWGENSQGVWTLSVIDEFGFGGNLQFSAIRLYGTNSGKQRVSFEQQHITVNEPIGAPQPKQIIVRRLGGSTGAFSVDYQTTISSATAGSDFVDTFGTLNFADGETSKTFDLNILNDNDPEDLESVNIALVNLQDQGAGVSFGGTTLATVDIVDSQTNPVSIAASDPIASETTTEDIADPGEFTITRGKVTSTPLTVFFTLSGTAREGTLPTDDFEPLTASGQFRVATIPAFEASVKVPIRPRDDNAIEGTETVTATLVPNGTQYVLGNPQTATVQIIDNDRPSLQIIAVDDLAVESATPTNFGSFEVRRSPATDRPLQVVLNFGGTQILGVNYLLTYPDAFGNTVQLSNPLVSNIVEIPAEQSSVLVTLIPLDDDVYQATKTVEISLRPSTEYDFSFGFLTTTRLNIIETDPFPDTKVPTVTIATPKNGARIPVVDLVNPDNTKVLLSGTAADTAVPGRTASVDKIFYRINRGQWQLLTPFTPSASVSWSTDDLAPLIPAGFCILDAQAVDVDGNPSKIATTTFKRVQERALSVTINGGGTVSGNQATYEVGDTVKITATPSAGNIFGGWTGTLTASSKVLTFTMPDSDVALTANFAANPFTPATAGNYSGLVQGPSFTFETSGYVSLSVGSTGVTTGKLTISGVTYPFKGEFLSTGTLTVTIPRKNTTPLLLNVTADLDPNGTRRITGTLNAASFSANVSADRAAYGKSSPASSPIVGNYTILMPPANPIANLQNDPRGFGIGKVKIGVDGVARFTGTLPDGTKASFNQPLSKDNTWPLFLTPYKKKGVLLGNITIDATQPTTDMGGTYDWFKPVSTKDLFFPLGFKIEDASLIGSLYVAPSTGSQALSGFASGSNNAKVVLEEGSLLATITKTVTYDFANKISVTTPGDDKLVAQIVSSTGDFKGNFTHPVSGKKVNFTGILFQKRGEAYGFFPGSSVPGVNPQSGRATLTKP